MSKKSQKSNQARQQARAASRPASKPVSQASKKPTAGKTTTSKNGQGKYSASAKFGVTAKPAGPQINLMAARITAIVIAVLFLAGAVYVIATQVGKFTAPGIIEVVLLVLIGGFAVFTAVKPALVAEWTGKLK
jgi:hypothetical protein